jgi:hypothetical protein
MLRIALFTARPFNDCFSILGYTESNDGRFNDLEMMWTEALVANLRYLA